MASSGRPDIGISTIPYAPIRQIRQNSPLPGLFPKSPSTVPCLSNLFQKICLSTGDYRKNTPKRSHPFGTFSKNLCLSTADYQKKYQKRSHLIRKKSEKTSPLHQCMSDFYPQIFHGFQKKLKNFYIHTYHISDLEQFFAPFSTQKQSIQRRLAFLHLPRLFPKRPPSVLPLSEKNLKKSSPHH